MHRLLLALVAVVTSVVADSASAEVCAPHSDPQGRSLTRDRGDSPMHRPAVRSKVEIAGDGRLVSVGAPPFGNGPLATQFQLKTIAARMKTTVNVVQ